MTTTLSLSAADRIEVAAIAAEIEEHGGSRERWDRADRTPAIAAEVHNRVVGGMYGPSCHVTPAEMLEQFRRYGEMGMPRGGRLWTRAKAA